MATTQERQGHCYAFAFREVVARGGDLVHGTALGAESGHAWVDHGATIYEPTHDRHYPKAEYLERFQAQESQRYDSVTAQVTFLREGHYGPWH